jgi:hypothetical protein
MNVAAHIRFALGTVIKRRISRHSSAGWAISFSTALISVSKNAIDMPQTRVNGFALLDGQLHLGEPPPTADAKQVRERGPFDRRRCSTAEISFFERVRACISCSRRCSRRRRIWQRSSGIQTASSSPFQHGLANVRASSLSVSHARSRSPCRPD